MSGAGEQFGSAADDDDDEDIVLHDEGEYDNDDYMTTLDLGTTLATQHATNMLSTKRRTPSTIKYGSALASANGILCSSSLLLYRLTKVCRMVTVGPFLSMVS